ncbi:MHYT domain-containing protein [uncultured Phenylobacterium sp.]|uniref:ATP-binding protein n=1 Tax=uncultured Phenylobacterium sp. TaxID=349273 RepID=UPI0025E7DF6A|nr:MHYT domain-containing protein [uncultured Phenylobacterium sp.]
MFAVLGCLEDHDWRLMAAGTAICIVAAAAAFGFQTLSRRAWGDIRTLWLGLTALVAGSGVWAMHFIAMLAYQPALRAGYDPVLTVLSLLLAVLGMSMAFTASIRPERGVRCMAGSLAGGGIVAMHYLGIAALRVPATFVLSPSWTAGALAVGLAGATLAFWARGRFTGGRGWAAATLLFSVSACGLHFGAMVAMQVTLDPRIVIPPEAIGRGVLAGATTALAAVILAVALALIWVERMGRRVTLAALVEALHAVPTGLAVFDAADRLVTCNRSWTALSDEVGAPCDVGATRRGMFEAALRQGWFINGPPVAERRFAASHRESTVTELQLPGGRRLTLEGFRSADGGSIGVIRDVTAEKQEAERLAAARDAAEAASQAKSAFLANISHEIRTPLNGLLGMAEVLAYTELTAQQRKFLVTIRESGEHLDSLLSDLLDLARVEAGAEVLDEQTTDIAELAASVRDLLEPRASEKGLSLVLDVAPGADALVSCDPKRLRQALTNLVSNAVKFTDQGLVTISLRREGDDLLFAVRDTGSGFDPLLKSKLFRRFQQADDGLSRAHGGAGLGLALCDHYVRLMGGELDCDSAQGVGSTFRFRLTLPVCASPTAADGPAAELPGAPAGGPRVLVVDDNPINRQVLGLMLEALGFDSEGAENGELAVGMAKSGRFDAVLMDLQMPVMDGLEAIRRIRFWERDAGRGRLPIWIVSANCLAEHVSAGAAAGADGHLAKPVSVAQLAATIAAWQAEQPLADVA